MRNILDIAHTYQRVDYALDVIDEVTRDRKKATDGLIDNLYESGNKKNLEAIEKTIEVYFDREQKWFRDNYPNESAKRAVGPSTSI